jgi:cytoskeletal protein RodZ
MKKIIKQNLLITFLLTFILVVGSLPAWGDSTNDDNDQTNTSGSNTQITGGYTATTTNNNDGQTNTTTSTTSNTTTSNGSSIPVNSSNAPSYSAMSQDVCSMGISGGVSTLGFGASIGKHVRDLKYFLIME